MGHFDKPFIPFISIVSTVLAFFFKNFSAPYGRARAKRPRFRKISFTGVDHKRRGIDIIKFRRLYRHSPPLVGV